MCLKAINFHSLIVDFFMHTDVHVHVCNIVHMFVLPLNFVYAEKLHCLNIIS